METIKIIFWLTLAVVVGAIIAVYAPVIIEMLWWVYGRGPSPI
jgi:hypothetical protein